ncbi:flagellar hook-basal body complex protein [Intestinimonas sp. HCP28S3_D6]|uniref:flagellar hook-basal body complex protein n=1 Tax=Intestinimonas sp. HCP28S3_D6 TaxID=3438942 RepID=UPI003F8CDC27
MALTGAMSAGISGLKAHMDALTVVGNNVANVNTAGYKPGRVTFKESIYSTQAAGSDGTDTVGGTNPRQTGYGCSVGTIDLDMSSMNVDSTGNGADVAIQGDGFFLVGDKTGVSLNNLNSLMLTRVGKFRIDNNGYLTDNYGNIVYGFATCNMNGNNKDTAAGLNGDGISTQLVPLRLPLAANGKGTDPANSSVGDAIYPGVDGNGNNDYGTFDDAGSGYECITYNSLSIGADGKVVCVNDKTGDPVTIGYIAMATVPNPAGLTHTEGPYYKAMEGAGKMAINTAGGALAGQYLNNMAADNANASMDTLIGKGSDLLSGFLEQSGTDLATEFANMITYQRGYQANTRIVTVTDSMLEELVNMKR